ncbi:hypothetical protein H5410_064597, partial [Solanum commersonii]
MIVTITSNVSLHFKKSLRSTSDFYYNMKYMVLFLSFISLPLDVSSPDSEFDYTISSDSDVVRSMNKSNKRRYWTSIPVVLEVHWDVLGLKVKHPETEVRNESAEDFLLLLKEWEQLCASCSLLKSNKPAHPLLKVGDEDVEDDDDGANDDGGSGDNDECEYFEVEQILEVCYGDPKEIKKSGLYFKEPIEGLDDCQDKIKDFVTKGFKASVLPLPGEVDKIIEAKCHFTQALVDNLIYTLGDDAHVKVAYDPKKIKKSGPYLKVKDILEVCYGDPKEIKKPDFYLKTSYVGTLLARAYISGFSRFRDSKNPLQDPKNKQLE